MSGVNPISAVPAAPQEMVRDVQQMAVQIPDGVAPGMMFAVMTPQGITMQVEAPAASVPGQTIMISVPTVAAH